MPVAANGYVYMGGDEDGSELYAVNETTGKLVWNYEFEAGGLGATVGGGRVYFTVPCDAAAFVAGKRIWNYNSGCDGGGGSMSAYYAGSLYASDVNAVLNAATGKITGSIGSDLPAFYGKASFAISDGGLVATNITTGNINWFFTPTDNLSLPPVTVNTIVATLSDAGVLYILDQTTGRVKQTLKLGLGSQSGPQGAPASGLGAAPNLLLVPSGSKLVAIGD